MRRPRPLPVSLVALALVTAALGPAVGTAAVPGVATVAAPPDPASDTLGWEDGRWHNESLDVDPSDGLNDRELDAVVARAMARVEVVRQLEFDEHVPVEIQSREAFREETADRYADVSTADRLHQNVKFEALFMVGEDTDAVDLQESNAATGTLGYYSSSEQRIVVVSTDTESPQLDEITLAQELFHALQDQHFEMTGPEYNQSTEERHNAVDGIIEGDGNYVDYLYERRCGDEWDCLRPDDSGGGGAGYRHVGLALLRLVPYSDGPPFVQDIRQAGGWEAVNAVYDDPPESTEQLIHPEKYGEDPPREVTVEDRSTDRWYVPDVGAVDYAAFGEAGIFLTLWYPSYVLRDDAVVPLSIRGGPAPDLYDYDHRYSAGWDGDRLVPYVTDDSAETNETGYVWKTVWDSPDEASEFADGYRALLDFHDADPVGRDTYVVPTAEERGYGDEFGDAVHLAVEGDTVTVVNAPTVEALSEVRADVTVRSTTTGADTTRDGTTRDGTTTAGTTTATERDGTTGTASAENPGTPGFTVAVALLALALVAVARARSR